MAGTKRIRNLTIITSLASIILGAYYEWIFVHIWGVIEEDVIFWGGISIAIGAVGILLLLLDHFMQKTAEEFWQRVIRIMLALWHLGILLLQVIPIIIWLSGGMVSDKPYASKAVPWGAAPHILMIFLASVTIYHLLRKWLSAAKRV